MGNDLRSITTLRALRGPVMTRDQLEQQLRNAQADARQLMTHVQYALDALGAGASQAEVRRWVLHAMRNQDHIQSHLGHAERHSR